MPRYTISIEIDNATSDKQTNISQLMKEHNFLPIIMDCNGDILFLPAYTYAYTSILSPIDVAEKVYDILQPSYPTSRILVTKSIGRAWKGLNLYRIEHKGLTREHLILVQKQ